MNKSLQQRTVDRLSKDPELSAAQILSGADILGTADELKARQVPVPEWTPNGLVYVAELDADERDELETQWLDYRDCRNDDQSSVGFRAFVAAFCLCNCKRDRLFADDVEKAAQIIGNRNGKATSRIFATASRINGLTASDIDQLEKNSPAPANQEGSDAGSGGSPSTKASDPDDAG